MKAWLDQINLRVGAANLTGVIAGLLGLLISYLGQGLVQGRDLGDPMPLMLTAQNVLRGNFLYMDWRTPLAHLLFAAFLGFLAVGVLFWLGQAEGWGEDDARRAARVTAVINIGVIAIMEVDAVIVAFWYAIAGFVSVSISSFVAGRLARYFLVREQNEFP